jgi:hypothetical protein
VDDSENKAPAKRKAPPHAWKPGQSGNPGGRPKDLAAFRERLKKLDDVAEQALAECLQDSDGRVRVAALKEFFDRRYGKASQPITGEDGKPLRLEVGLVDVLKKLADGE